jgi:D-sedoheptulose 7-phosphate isomerase
MERITQYMGEMKTAIDLIPMERFDQIVDILHQARLNGQQVFIMGNGGSASTASHFVCDLAKNTRNYGWPNFRAIGLTDNVAILTAYANDEGYENALAGQLANLIRPNDVVVAISCSGNSANVLRAVELANNSGAITVGLTGRKGGHLATMCNVNISAQADAIQQQEDLHLMLCHMITVALNEQPKVEVITRRPAYAESNTLSLIKSLFGKDVFEEPGDVAPRGTPVELVQKISQEMAQNLDLHEMLTYVLQMTLDSVGASSGSIMVLNDEGEVIDGLLAYAGKVNTGSLDRMEEIKKQGLAGWVVENRKAALIKNTREDPRWLRREFEESTGDSRSALSVPLITQDRVVGVVTLVHPKPGWFTMEDLSLLTAITITISYSVNAHNKAASD